MKEFIVISVLICFLIFGIYHLSKWADTPSLDETQKVQSALPDGCKLNDLGSYGGSSGGT